MGFDRYRERAGELARSSALEPAGRLCGWRVAWLSVSMGGRVRASRPRSVRIIVAGYSVLVGSISWLRRTAHRCGLPAIRRHARGARLTCWLTVKRRCRASPRRSPVPARMSISPGGISPLISG